MSTFGYSDLISLDLGKLETAVADWKTMVGALAKLKADAGEGMLKKSEAARWQGVNASVTREFVRSAVKKFADLHAQAQSVHTAEVDAAAPSSTTIWADQHPTPTLFRSRPTPVATADGRTRADDSPELR
ncbi:hypothetical protein ACFQ61_02570 [Streptomyces sp. NPDC056500]|uniref:hypothetical protein n=1 Tax=Streptomyces sp. NPDC056500 TaxID=3345840 RepID=UPI003691170C